VSIMTDSIKAVKEIAITVKCARCGREIEFQPTQFSRFCPGCGNQITLTKQFRKRRLWQQGQGHEVKAEDEGIKCQYCRDTGILVIEKQINNCIYQYAYRCICEAGSERQEQAIPQAWDVDLSLRV